jgi:tripartite ATP-independent transporter DctM subunit
MESRVRRVTEFTILLTLFSTAYICNGNRSSRRGEIMVLFRRIRGGFIYWTISFLVVSMVVIVFIQVISRYVFNSPLYWSEEMARILFIWIAFVGAFLGLRSKEHIRVGAFISRFSPEIQTVVSAVVTFLIFYFLLYLIRVGIEVVKVTSGTLTPALQISMAYIHIIVPISASLMIVHLIGQFCQLKWKLAALAGIISLSIVIGLYVIFGGERFSGGSLTGVICVCIAALITAGMPIAFCVGFACILFLALFERIPLLIAQTRMIGGIDSFPLLAVPFFVLAGDLMNIGGITKRLVALAMVMVGHIRGGLGMVVVVGEYFFSGISGSTTADVSAIGSLLIPAMQKAGYKSETAASVVSAATAMGILVPPCILMVILGGITGISIGALFMGGFLPAIVIALCIMVLIYIQAVKTNLPVEARLPLRGVFKAIIGAIIPLLLPVIIFGGILSGAATATEVSVVAVIYAAVIGLFFYKEIKIEQIIPMLVRTAIVTGTVMLLVGTTSVFSWILSVNQVPQIVGGLVSHLSSSALVFLLLSNLTFIILGAILEGLPAMLILIPIFLPLTAQYGISHLHFGILAIASIGIGFFLPPIGVGIFIACTFAKVDIGKMIIPFMPYLMALLIGLFIITAFPWFTLALPNIFFK